MRLFHHYLIKAYPSIPYEYEDIWVEQIPPLSHHVRFNLFLRSCAAGELNTTYLMDAILALAGSKIALLTDESDKKSALRHRQRALHGLNEAFSRWPPTAEEAHVMLAASYLLSFPATFMEDGFLEHIISLRGGAMLSQHILGNEHPGPFAVQVNMQTFSIADELRKCPVFDQELLCQALESVKAFHHLIAATEPSSVERTMVLQYVEILQSLLHTESDSAFNTEDDSMPTHGALATPPQTPIYKSSPKLTTPYGHMSVQNPHLAADTHDAFDSINWANITQPDHAQMDALRSFNALMETLLLVVNCPYADVERLFDSTNQLSNVIMAHFLAIRFIVSPLGGPRSVMRTPVAGMVQWTARVMDAVEDEKGGGEKWTEYVKWPRTSVQEGVRRKRVTHVIGRSMDAPSC